MPHKEKLNVLFPNSTTDEKRALIKAATEYRSSEGMGAVYIGGHHGSQIIGIMGGVYGKSSMRELIKNATQKQIDLVFQSCAHMIVYMTENPRGKCPCCNQIIPTDKA